MAKNDMPVKSHEDESGELFREKDNSVSTPSSDPINDRAWEGLGEKYVPRYPSGKRDRSGWPPV